MVLDTCALLWLSQGGGKLSPSALQQIAAAPVVGVSAISGFEIALRYHQGKLELPVLPGEWFKAVLEHHGLSEIPLHLDVCVAATELPPVHKDPCDRFIIATARSMGLPVVTGDSLFEEYDIEVIA